MKYEIKKAVERELRKYQKKSVRILDREYSLYVVPQLCDEDINVFEGFLFAETESRSEFSYLKSKYKPPVSGYTPRIGLILHGEHFAIRDYRKNRYVVKTVRKVNRSFFNKLKVALSEPMEGNFNKLFDRTDVIEEFYILYKKAREYLLKNISGISEEEKRKGFVDNFMMQMLTLWYLQERGFFNNDKNYFITKFEELKQKKLINGFKNYYEFLVYLFEKISGYDDKQYIDNDPKIGKVVVIGPAVFLNGEHSRAVSIPDKCFHKEGMTDILINTPPKKVSQEVPLLNLFESRDWTEGNIDEFVLGAIYEKLITYMERKKLGAYYTPEEITSYICKNTVEPYLVDRVNERFNKNFESIDQIIGSNDKEILLYLFEQLKEIKILDPAVGSAHFLESAINVLVEIYEKIWDKARGLNIKEGLEIKASDEKGEIKTIDLLEIGDDGKFKLLVKFFIILSKNVYGVDINPSALKVARARLFLSLAKHFKVGKEKGIFIRFPNVHFNLREGNSLIGYVKIEREKSKGHLQLDLFVKGEQIECISEKIKVLSELKTHLEKTANALGINGNVVNEVEDLNRILSKKQIPWDDLEKVLRTKEKLIQILIASLNSQYAVPLNDLLREVTDLFNHKLDEKFAEEHNIKLEDLEKIKTFHWIFEFPEVFLDRGGFEVVVGNPPWDKVKPHDPEFFEKFEPNYREFSKSEQKKLRKKLLKNNDILKLYNEYKKVYDIQMKLFRNIYFLQGESGDLNLYKLFLERALTLSMDKVCLLIPGQITVDKGSTQLRAYMLDNQMVYEIIGLTNKNNLFPGIDNNQKFVLLFIDKKTRHKKIRIFGWIPEFKDFTEDHIIEVSGETYKKFDKFFTFYLDTDRKNIATFEKIMNLPHVKRLEELNFHYWQEYHATNDSNYFNDREGKYLLFSGKAIDQYDCMAKIWIEKHGRSAKWKPYPFPKEYENYRTEYYVNEMPERIKKHHKKEKSKYRIVMQDITGAVNNARTVYACLLHKKHLTNNTLHNLYIGEKDEELLFYLAILNSFVLDWQARRKVATHLNKFIIETFLVPSFSEVDEESRNNIVKLSFQLSVISPDFDELVRNILEKDSYKEVGIMQGKERQKVKNKIDAMVAHLYHLTYDELKAILNSFPLVDNEIKEEILKEF